MKKVLVLVIIVFLIVGCSNDIDLVGTWRSGPTDQSAYIFNSDGTCSKETTNGSFSCTYVVGHNKADITFKNPNMKSETAQFAGSQLMIDTEKYTKEN